MLNSPSLSGSKGIAWRGLEVGSGRNFCDRVDVNSVRSLDLNGGFTDVRAQGPRGALVRRVSWLEVSSGDQWSRHRRVVAIQASKKDETTPSRSVFKTCRLRGLPIRNRERMSRPRLCAQRSGSDCERSRSRRVMCASHCLSRGGCQFAECMGICQCDLANKTSFCFLLF